MEMIKQGLSLSIILVIILACGKSEVQHIAESKDLELVQIEDGEHILLRKDDYGTYSFNNWNDFNLFNVRLHYAESMEFDVPVSTVGIVNNTIENMDKSIPDWLKTEKVIQEINEVKVEYNKLLEERFKPGKVVIQNWKELTEEFDDVRNELSATVKEYISE